MIRKILTLGMLVSNFMINAAPVAYEEWEGKAIVDNIVSTQAYPDDATIQRLRDLSSQLQGGALTIRNKLIASWQTGDTVRDEVPEELSQLASKLYGELSPNSNN
jgi:exoribonuclease R